MSSEIEVEFLVNNTLKFSKKIHKEQKLSELRKNIGDLIKDDDIFLSNDKFEILKEDEEDFKVSELLVDSKIYIKSKSISDNSNKVTKNIVLKDSKYLFDKNNLKIYLYNSDKLTPEEEARAIVIMVVGLPENGKTTLLNAFINYILGIKYEDDFRYNIIYENNDNIKENKIFDIPIYNIRSPDGTIFKIIDTPSFSDAGGIKRDIEIFNKIKQAIIQKLDYINCICIVIQSTYRRLGLNLIYIYNWFLDLFGDEVKSNFCFMITFCDGLKPFVLNILENKESEINQIIRYIEDPWYFTFNNIGILEKNSDNKIFNILFFEYSNKSFENFTKKIKSLKKITIKEKNNVLIEREHLKKQIELLQYKLKEEIDKLNYIKSIISMIKSVKGDFNESKNFSKKIKKRIIKKVPINDGKLITTCLNCNQSCHIDCKYNDYMKWKCCAIDNSEDAKCLICKGKCSWIRHINLPYIYKEVELDEFITLKDLKNKYYESKNELNIKAQLIHNIKNELIQVNKNCLEYVDLIIKKNHNIQEFALSKSLMTDEEYIDLLIQNEEPDNKERIEGLKLIKEQKLALREIYGNKNLLTIDIGKFIGEFLEKKHKLK